jgi:flagellin
MSQSINTNIASINAQRNLETNSSSLQTSLQRLSSGLRINSAKDDAAGLSISDRMNAQIRGLNQAARNANDAISLAQTAEGAISGMSDNLQRLRELSVQAANSTNTAADRASIQAEVSQLVQEIDRVATVTDFNGIKLLDGTFKNQSFQVGANAGQTIDITVANVRASSLGSGDSASLSASGNANALSAGDIVLNGISVSGSLASSDNASSANNSYSGIAKAAAINAVSDRTGVTAKADSTIAVAATVMSNPGTASTGTVTINGTAITVATTIDSTANRANIVAAINLKSSQTGVIATDSLSLAVGIKLTAADGRNIAVTHNLLTASVGITEATYYSGVTMTSNRDITVTSAGTIGNGGLVAGLYKAQVATASSISGASSAVLAGADVKINGISIGASDVASYDTASTASSTASAMSKAAAINALQSQTGVTATAQTEKLGSAITAAASTGVITINGVATASITTAGSAATDRAAVVSAINLISARTGVVATDLGGTTAGNTIKLTAADGRNINIVSTFATSVSTTGIDGSTSANVAAATTYGTIALSSSKAFTIEQGQSTTANAVYANLGMNTGTYGAGRNGQSLTNVDVSTLAGANAAIVAVDNAITSLNNSRANLGSVLNRFSSTVSNLGVASENVSAAQSRIRDTDFAKETAKLSRGQILQQAGVAMLAQANALPNTILALLK